ncbi:MAG TPA: FAD-dependent oxidoreductase [Candidatus Acidoferrum sp.]|nr:FAD-dependent oxidoreductase [Candidatus Acidoferrum sp.]
MGTVAFQIHDEIVRASLYKVEQYDPTPGSDDSSANVSGARSLARASRVQAELPPEQPGSRPGLSALQLSVLRRYGTEHGVVEGEVLFADGDETYDLIVVLEGEVEIIEHYGQVNEVVITAYGPGEFPGEMGLLTGQRAYLTGAVSVAGRILRIPVEQVHVIMAQELDLSELILRAFLVRHSRLTHRGSGLTLVGSRFDVDTHRLLEVLARNRLSSRWLELEGSPEAEALLVELAVPVADLPIVVVPGGPLLRNPSAHTLLDALGLVSTHEGDPSELCDLLVVGGGPAGLAAAVYGASEGMATTLAEDTALGGQAGTSSRIENYLGFPAGLSGEELAARAALQAQKFGVRFKMASRAVALSSEAGSHQVRFEDGTVVTAKSVIIATGARYNRLPLDRLTAFEGVGVYYAATQMEAQACAGGPVVIVGGGNSAGQAALFLARTCTQVHIVIRGEFLGSSMSRYLVDQIEHHPKILVSPRTEVIGLVGEQELEGVVVRNNDSETSSTLAVCGLFVFIGAKPSTEWIEGQLAEDDDGFLLTGSDIPATYLDEGHRSALFLETSRPGIFCVGDVRSGSVKRAATAIGEGSMAVRLVFERLQEPASAV